jgi:hypothetical protein
MPDKTQKQMVYEVHIALFGVPDTEDKGLCGDIKEIKSSVSALNGDLQKYKKKTDRHSMYFGWMAKGGGIILGAATAIVGVLKALGIF